MKIRSLLLFALFFPALRLAAQCAPGEIRLDFSLYTDQYGYETSWEVTDFSGATVYASGNGYGSLTNYTQSICVPDTACLRIVVRDSYGDGMCCNFGQGWYQFSVNGTVVATGGDFQDEDVTTFNCPPGFTCSDAVPVVMGQHTAGFDDTWYQFTCPFTGSYTVSTCGLTACDTKVWVYSTCQGIIVDETMASTLTYDDNDGGCGQQAQVTLGLQAGNTIYIRIGDANDACNGPIDWQLIYNGPVSGCMDPAACNYSPLATVSDSSCVYPGDPDCTTGPDLIVRGDVLRNSLQLDLNYNATDPCLINEQCVTGLGQRQLLRFTTHIQNIGEVDYHIGTPAQFPDQFVYDGCHNHNHYVGYAEYLLYDTLGNLLPAAFKNGFCVLDLECSGGGTAKFGCGNQGISAHCGDIYSSALQCQWIDLTDVPDGRYTFIVRVNWDQSPDGMGRIETDYANNWSQVCLVVDRSNGTLQYTVDPNCPAFTDCAGIPFGSTLPDCNGVCGGAALQGDLDQNGTQNMMDVQDYFNGALDASLTASPCNDLFSDGILNVYDAALLNSCLLYGAGHTHPGAGGGPHDHCNFPAGLVNIFDTAALSIDTVNFDQQYIDINILNPSSEVLAYQFRLSGVNLLMAESLADPNDFPVNVGVSPASRMVAGLSMQDSSIDRSNQRQSLVRVYFTHTTGPEICIDSISAIVDKGYFAVVPRIDGGCVPVPLVGIENQPANSLGLQIAPNPFDQSTRFTFRNRTNESLRLELTDALGRVVRIVDNIQGESFVLQRENLPAGTYFFRMSGSAAAQSGRLVVD
jgi:hypothetical protein